MSNASKAHAPVHLATVLALPPRQGVATDAQSSAGALPDAKALVTPFLAYNLGLEYHAAPFYTHTSQPGQQSADYPEQASVSADRPSCGSIRLSRWQGSSSKASSGLSIPVADAVWVSAVRQPDAGFLQAQLSTEDGPSAAAHELSDLTLEKQQQKKQSDKQADDSFDNSLVAALQSYFKQQPR